VNGLGAVKMVRKAMSNLFRHKRENL